MVLGCYWTLPCGDLAFSLSLSFFFLSLWVSPASNSTVCVRVFIGSRISSGDNCVSHVKRWAARRRRVTVFLFFLCRFGQLLLHLGKKPNINYPEISTSVFVFLSFSVSGLSQRSLRVCQAKRVAPPIVPESATTATSSSTSLSSQQHQSHHQQQHRHSGSSFDSGGSAESSSGGYCSGTGSLSSCHAPSSSAWSQTGSDQRSSIGLDDAFLPPPPSSPAAHVNNNSGNKHHHMYSRGTYSPS